MRPARAHLTRFFAGFVVVLALIPALVLGLESVLVAEEEKAAPPEPVAAARPPAPMPDEPPTLAPPDYWAGGNQAAKKTRPKEAEKDRKRVERPNKKDAESAPERAPDAPAADAQPRAQVVDLPVDDVRNTVEQMIDACTADGGDCPTGAITEPVVDLVEACTAEAEPCAAEVDELANPVTDVVDPGTVVVAPATPDLTGEGEDEAPPPGLTLLVEPHGDLPDALLDELGLRASDARHSWLRIALRIPAERLRD